MTIDQLTEDQKALAQFVYIIAAENKSREMGYIEYADLLKSVIEKLKPGIEKIKMKHTLKCQQEENQKALSFYKNTERLEKTGTGIELT